MTNRLARCGRSLSVGDPDTYRDTRRVLSRALLGTSKNQVIREMGSSRSSTGTPKSSSDPTRISSRYEKQRGGRANSDSRISGTSAPEPSTVQAKEPER